MVTCASGGATIAIVGNNATVRNNSVITGNIYALQVLGGTLGSTIVLNNLSSTNPGDLFGGVRFLSPATTGKFENNTVLRNSLGIVVDATPPSMGDNGAPATSVGNNSISCNITNDLYLTSAVGGINAQFNRWDHGPPTLNGTTSGGGTDIFYNGGGVTYGAANLVVPSPCP
jgi:hypothetical protein